MKKFTILFVLILGLIFSMCKKDNETLPEFSCNPNHDTFIDTRDGQEYCMVLLEDGNIWMGQNLNYDTTDSWCFNESVSYCEKHGRLYNWSVAMTACPDGWHLPTSSEWKALVDAYGGLEDKSAYDALIRGGSSGFDASLGGKHSFGDNKNFYGVGDYGFYWSSTESRTDWAWTYRFLRELNVTSRINGSDEYQLNRISCRCIKD